MSAPCPGLGLSSYVPRHDGLPQTRPKDEELRDDGMRPLN